jgi:uncharacterized protein (DUF433 family)
VPAFALPPTEVRALPNYALSEAAHYLMISVSTLKSWVVGRNYPTLNGGRKFRAIIPPAQKTPVMLLSFINLVEAHVLHAIRHQHGVKLSKVRSALDFVEKELQVSHPLVNQSFQTDGVDLFIRHLGSVVVASKGGARVFEHLHEWLDRHLARVEYDEQKVARRLFPFTRPGHTDQAPKFIVIDPRISFGRPIIEGSGVPTLAIWERYQAGDSPEHLAKDYRRTLDEIHEAIRCEGQRK